MTPRERGALAAIVASFYPGDSRGLPGAESLALEEDFSALLGALPPLERAGMRVVLAGAAVFLPLLLLGNPRPLARLGASDRERCMTALLSHRRYLLRQLGLLLKATSSTLYLQHAEVRAALELPPVEEPGPAAAAFAQPGGGQIVAPGALTGDVVEETDFAIVGSGAAGATAARVLSEAGFGVCIVEEGPWLPAEELGRGTLRAFTGMFRDGGAQMTGGAVKIPILQASCVGGSTVINSGIMWRTPGEVLQQWHRRYGLADALPEAPLLACFEQLESELSIRPVEEDRLGAAGRALRDGAAALGYEGQPTQRSEKDCEGLSRCLEGCRRARRQSMNHSYVPHSLAHGARLYTSCRVERLVPAAGSKSASLRGTFAAAEPGGPRRRLEIRARKGILVGASAVHSPALLQRSGLDLSGQVGLHFQGHPGVAVAAMFDRPVRIWEGATQAYEVTHFRSRGLKIETLNVPVEILAARLPGAGSKLMEHLRCADRMAVSAIPIKAAAEGSVRSGPGGLRLRYVPGAGDVATVMEGIRRTAEIYFAAGAKAVYPGVAGLPERLDSPDELSRLAASAPPAQAFSWVMTHMMGTCRMGPDPRSSAVDFLGRPHGVEGIHVIDSSVFPTNLGVNPQHTLMAVAMHLTRRIAGL